MCTKAMTCFSLLSICVVLAQPTLADPPGLSDRARPRPDHLVRLRIDPNGSVVQILPRASRVVINSSFAVVSVSCLDCGTPCPPFERSVQVVLEATTAVDAGYGVSDLTSNNYTLLPDGEVQYSTRAALSAGQQITITITGDVLDCTNWFSVYFNLCDLAPRQPTDPCPPVTECTSCHGQPPDGSGPPNTPGAHETHHFATKGPGLDDCFVCHAPLEDGKHNNGLPSFASGTDGNGNGNIDLGEADVCASCHSPGGPYDGVTEAVANWSSGTSLSCEGCHDSGTSVIGGVQAPATGGDNLDYGFFMNGHGRAGIDAHCVDCHDPTGEHIDGLARTFSFDSGHYGPSVSGVAYAAGYRLSFVGADVPLMIPASYSITFGYDAGLMRSTAFRRCFACHSPDQVLDDTPGNGISSNFKASLPNPPRNYSYAWGAGADVNEHVAHILNYVGPFADSDWDVSTNGSGGSDGRDTLTTCTSCHNVHGAMGVHGSSNAAMMRDGSLAGRTGYGFSYVIEDVGGYPWVTSTGATQTTSVGAILRNNTSNMCGGSMCHDSPPPPPGPSYDATGSSWGTYLEYYRPFQDRGD